MGDVSLAGVPLADAPTGEGAKDFWCESCLPHIRHDLREVPCDPRYAKMIARSLEIQAWFDVPAHDEWWHE